MSQVWSPLWSLQVENALLSSSARPIGKAPAIRERIVEDAAASLDAERPPLVVFVGVAAIAGIGAAVLPARRASRLDVLTALQYE